MITIHTAQQTLSINDKIYPISTAKNGLGEDENSFKTPRGKFKICAKIGENQPKYTIFTARKPCGIWDKKPTDKDLVLSRILWLDGIETHNINTKNRYIYIHGTGDEQNIGTPVSMGCIRMLNTDIIEIFDLATVGDIVIIT
jgi:lipoprotein-anchoring transpeptidase ErfK/SrfK